MCLCSKTMFSDKQTSIASALQLSSSGVCTTVALAQNFVLITRGSNAKSSSALSECVLLLNSQYFAVIVSSVFFCVRAPFPKIPIKPSVPQFPLSSPGPLCLPQSPSVFPRAPLSSSAKAVT